MTKSLHPKYPKRIRNGCASISENPKMHTCIRISDADSDTGPADVELGEWQVRVVPWVNYNQHCEGWITVDVRRPKMDSGKCRFRFAHNGTRFARSKDLQAAPDWGLPIDDLARYMRQVWGR